MCEDPPIAEIRLMLTAEGAEKLSAGKFDNEKIRTILLAIEDGFDTRAEIEAHRRDYRPALKRDEVLGLLASAYSGGLIDKIEP